LDPNQGLVHYLKLFASKELVHEENLEFLEVGENTGPVILGVLVIFSFKHFLDASRRDGSFVIAIGRNTVDVTLHRSGESNVEVTQGCPV
jgi:hypothetical protein